MDAQSLPELLKLLWSQSFFSIERNFDAVIIELNKIGVNPTNPALAMALGRAKFLTQKGKRTQYRYIQKYAGNKIALTTDVLPDELVTTLGKDFEIEILDLRRNYGQSGTCTAFLLRKILEK